MLTNHIPIYMQIADDIRNKILNEEYKINSKIPTEDMIVEQYDVSRMTGRQAVTELVNEGLVYRVHGKGVFVSRKKLERNLNRLNGFYEDMKEKGYTPGSKIIKFHKRLPTQREQHILLMKSNQEVYYIRRIRYIDDIPIALQSLIVPVHRVPNLDCIDLNQRSFYSYLEENGTPLKKAEQRMEAIMAPEIANEMDISPKLPFFYFERISCDKNEVPLELLSSYFRGDQYSYAITLYRD
ncbi:HTH-type transcriptional repressor YvoA [Lentibacillus kapialis]|uniref:HTH-type transcriptional repressor YvoA n=2 Tax=Lentibacillus kapialis TaxID=340214 RepID=A0A917PXF2_9BACI|nr:HTH-type transcriptional repressor YvoA [Lentibacillus kapialis]